MRVSFLIAGTQKGGTSALASFLAEHPQIVMAAGKEVHFFDNERLFRNLSPAALYEEYHRHFPSVDSLGPIGEATPIYMYWKPAARRIRQYNPQMKLILLLRNPVTRAYSHYAMQRSRGLETLSFSQALKAERRRRLRSFPRQLRRFAYVERGFYSKQIARLLRHFPRQQLLCLKSEDLRHRHAETMRQVYDFLGVERLDDPPSGDVFASAYESPLSPADRTFLDRRFAREIERLERLLGWDCSDWKPPAAAADSHREISA